ncbi:MAG: hypothetical protein JWM28_3775 [Chitinophagaceae bacterium]|nr:hypothetical protein [Chitinophagaceae bacterium]
MENIPNKTLLVALVEKNNTILMRKKPEGSAPYKETWYIFGCERNPTQEDSITLSNYLYENFDIKVDDIQVIGEDSEVKKDHDGIIKNFTYIDFRCKYKEGVPKKTSGIEKIEWISKDKLQDYDLVPPSLNLFKKIGYLMS